MINANHNNNIENSQINGARTTPVDNGQLVLDRLLASLSVENDITIRRRPSPPTNRNMTSQKNSENIFKYPTIVRDKNHNEAAAAATAKTTNGIHTSLNDVIANLTDFSRHELIRQQSLTNGRHSPIIVIEQQQQPTRYTFDSSASSSAATRRLASESEKSSSISPSLSEQSNGVVSWSDQVKFK